jgi:hypothetical protein
VARSRGHAWGRAKSKRPALLACGTDKDDRLWVVAVVAKLDPFAGDNRVADSDGLNEITGRLVDRAAISKVRERSVLVA